MMVAEERNFSRHTRGFVTPWNLRRNDGREVWSGAAYSSDGQLIARSQRQPGIHPVVVQNPEQVDTRPRNSLSGRWIYGGIWFEHFGHFLLETLTRFPVSDMNVDGIIFHAHGKGELRQYHRDLIHRLGWSGPILLSKVGYVVEDLFVSHQQVVLGESVSGHAVDVWDAISEAPRPRRRIFYSRARIDTGGGRSASNDHLLDAEMSERGFEVVYPEKLSVYEQVRLMAETETLVGVSGTALHGSVFMPRSSRVVEIADRRSRDRVWPNQSVINSAFGRDDFVIPYFSEGGSKSSVRDMRRTMRAFESCPY